MKIGNLLLKNNLFLAPMAGFTDMPFRALCKEYGASLVYTEMVSAKGLYYEDENTNKLLEIDKNENPIAIQIFGRDPKIMAEAAKKIEHLNFDILDINMGCPAPKIVKNFEGSALLNEPKLIGEIIKEVSNAIKKPVTVKIRKGFNDSNINAVLVAKIAEDNGASAICVHGRTREQYYSGKSDLDIIRQVKNSVSIPIIGNGDIYTPEDAEKMLKFTNCDALLIARGALGNPFIFREILYYLKTQIFLSHASVEERIKLSIRHLDMAVKFKGEYIGIREMRKHLSDYLKGLPNCKRLREKINKIDNYNELYDFLIKLI